MYTSANTYYLQILVCWKIFESLLQNLWFYKWFNLRKLFTFGPFLKEKCQITILNFSIFEEKKLSDTNLEKKLRNDQTEKLSKIKLSLQYHQDCQMSQAKVNFKLLQSRTTDAQRGNSLHCTARPKIHSHSKMFRYGRSIFCLPDQPNFSDIFDLCLRWVSVVRGCSLPFPNIIVSVWISEPTKYVLAPIIQQREAAICKMLVKSGLEKNILKFHIPLQRYLLTSQANIAFLGRFFCTGQQQLWRCI